LDAENNVRKIFRHRKKCPASKTDRRHLTYLGKGDTRRVKLGR
jgi:hypothetical protein